MSMQKVTEDAEKMSRSVESYFDEIGGLERRLVAVAQLAQGCSDPDKVSSDVLEEMGGMIIDYLKSKRICDYFFLNRAVDDEELETFEAKAALYVLEERFEN